MRTPKKTNNVYSYVLQEIARGKFRIGDRIPAERDLALQFNVSRPTVAAAIHRLVEEKVVGRNRNTGSVVVRLPARQELTFGAILLGMARHHQEETIFTTVGNELAHRALQEHSMVLLQDPSWSEDPADPCLAKRFEMIAQHFIARKVAGVFLMPQWILQDQYISVSAQIAAQFERSSIPVVLIDSDLIRYPDRSDFDVIGMDNFHAGYILAEHFLKLGCRKIDFFAIAMRHPTQEARIAGYIKAMENHGIPAAEVGIHYGNLLDADFVVDTLRQRQPEAVLVVNDFRAASVLRLASKAGIKVPQDLRIGGFDDLPMAEHLSVPLTTIRQPAAGIGAIAFQTMLQRIADPNLPPMHIELKGNLIVRESCGYPVKVESAPANGPMTPQ